MKSNIAIMGAGSWGTALGILLSKAGHNVSLWSRSQQDAESINTTRRHERYLPGIIIPDSVKCYTDPEKAAKNKDIIIFSIPTQSIRENARNFVPILNDKQIVVSVSKGIEEKTLRRPSEILKEEFPNCKIAVLSGPSHAEEVARSIPTTVVSASEDIQTARIIQDIFMTPAFRVYTNVDLTGVEVGGALKNIIALCAGISDGLGFGDNTKAALMTRGLTEIARLGQTLGAKAQTFAGLTGMGDLIVTCTSMHSRNRKAGMLIGQGKTVEQALEEVKMVVEGVRTAKAAHDLAKKCKVEMPIVEQAFKVLFKKENPRTAVSNLMIREKKHETEDIFID